MLLISHLSIECLTQNIKVYRLFRPVNSSALLTDPLRVIGGDWGYILRITWRQSLFSISRIQFHSLKVALITNSAGVTIQILFTGTLPSGEGT